MCKLVYIATGHELPLVPWDPAAPAFHLQPLCEEDAEVAARFSKPYVYFVGTTRGCGCDFGTWEDTGPVQEDAIAIFAGWVARGILAWAKRVRMLLGTQEKHELKLQKEREQGEKDWEVHLADNEKLISLIECNTTPGHTMELYYCWAGDYADEAIGTEEINLTETNLREGFYLYQKVLNVYNR